jgi:multidrug transporter EmrE-like cation transporter
MAMKGQLPDLPAAKLLFLVKSLFGDPFIISGFVAAFAASLFWMAAMTKFELSFAYPFMSLAFVLVFLMSVALFGETFTIGKVVGLALIVSGIVVTVKL